MKRKEKNMGTTSISYLLVTVRPKNTLLLLITPYIRSHRRSEVELVRELTLGESPARLQVLGQVLRLLDRLNDRLVDLLLVGRLGFGERLLLFGLALREELLLCGGRRLLRGLGEVSVVELVVNLDYEV